MMMEAEGHAAFQADLREDGVKVRQALGIARERQTNLDGWAEPKMEAYIAKKQKLEQEQG